MCFLQMGQTAAELWRFNSLQNSVRPPSWIFKRLKF